MKRIFRFSGFPILFALLALVSPSCGIFDAPTLPLARVGTVAATAGKIGEPFGIATKRHEIFVSDGAKGIIWKIDSNGNTTAFARGFSTPSHIAFDGGGNLYVADSGDHTIRMVAPDGSVTVAAGVSGKRGYRDGPAASALFNAPVGIATADGNVYVADTYNDRIRVIAAGDVSTVAGGEQGFRDSREGKSVRFDTPTGLSMFGDNILVADTVNRRIRVVEPDGKTATLAGGALEPSDGLLGAAGFRLPVGITVDDHGSIFVADGDTVRVIGSNFIPIVRTIGEGRRGFADGSLSKARFNRPSGLAIASKGDILVADSDNSLVRVLTGSDDVETLSAGEFRDKRPTVAEFRARGESRWPFKDYGKPREIAGTLGEIRGKQTKSGGKSWFHNGLDIAGGYGEETVIIRNEKVLRPVAVMEFGNNRENIRFPEIGYVHLRIGRSAKGTFFKDERFQFRLGKENKPIGLRVPRGTVFGAGDVLGTLNAMNHVHLIAGPSGSEFNALDALGLPGAADSRVPVLEDVSILDSDWRVFETENGEIRINQGAKLRVVARVYDQMDGNAEHRRLGLYKLGYQMLDGAERPLPGFESPKWTIVFDRTPSEEYVGLVYAEGSRSGATGETIFNYVVSNLVNGQKSSEDFVQISSETGKDVVIRVFAADYFGNLASKDIKINVKSE